ncbi:hypothetical protein D3C78_1567900 [compost metagenome]
MPAERFSGALLQGRIVTYADDGDSTQGVPDLTPIFEPTPGREPKIGSFGGAVLAIGKFVQIKSVLATQFAQRIQMVDGQVFFDLQVCADEGQLELTVGEGAESTQAGVLSEAGECRVYD